MRSTTPSIAVLALLLFSAPTAAAAATAVLTFGTQEDASAASVGLQLPLQPKMEFLRSERLSTIIEFSLGYWRGHSSDRVNDSLVDVSVLPAIRFHPNGSKEQGVFFEAGIGAHLLSRTRIHDDRRFGSAFQFGDVVGIGWRLGQEGHYELGLRFQHVSNGGIKEPNQGINFLELRFVAPL